MTTPDSFHTPDPLYLGDPQESALDAIPAEALASLLDENKDVGDPANRDYGDRYTYRKVIGQGGQGIVISAWDSLLEREVAIKALKPPFEPAKESILTSEALVNGMLEHPNILPTYDLQADETNSPFFVMKKITGVSLEQLLRDSHRASATSPHRRNSSEYSRVRLLNVFLQVCHAIEYAHSRGVLHLDLKTENVKLGSFGEVYVLDWGFAAKMDEKQKYVGGTPIYIAPERLERKAPDQRSDIYSLGVMLYRILTYKHPRDVSKISFKEYRELFKSIPIIPLRERDRTLPADLEAIVMKALADKPADRYLTVRDLASDLEAFLAVLPVSAYGEGPLRRSWKFIRRHRLAASAFVIILATAMVAGVMAWNNHKASEKFKKEEDAKRRVQIELDAKKAADRRRGRARMPLEKAVELIIERRERVENERISSRKPEILKPAFDKLAEAIKISPDFAEVYYVRAKAYDLVGLRLEALKDFQKTYTLDKSFLMAHYYAGIIYSDKLAYPQHENARKEFRAMEKEYPDNEFAELGRARIAEYLGRTRPAERPQRYREALQHCEKALSINKNVSDVWYIRGMVYGSKKANNPFFNLKKALESYNQFLTTREATPSAFANRGDIHRQLGNIQSAIDDYKKALLINPHYTAALKNLGWTYYFYRHDPRKGLEYTRKAKSVNSQDFWVYMNEAAIYESLKEYEKAEEDYREAFDLCRAYKSLAPNIPLLHYRKGLFYFNRGRLHDAEQELDTALTKASGNTRAIWIHRRGIVKLARGDYAGAIRDFDTSLKNRTRDRIYPALMRWIALRLSNQPVGKKDLQNYLDARPDRQWLNAIGMYFLGEIKKNEILAQATSAKAQCETHFYLGALAMADGDDATATAHFRAVEATGVHLFMEYRLAIIFKARLTIPTGRQEEARDETENHGDKRNRINIEKEPMKR